MHELQYMQFNKLVKGKNGQLCKQWRRMLSETRITDNSNCLFCTVDTMFRLYLMDTYITAFEACILEEKNS